MPSPKRSASVIAKHFITPNIGRKGLTAMQIPKIGIFSFTEDRNIKYARQYYEKNKYTHAELASLLDNDENYKMACRYFEVRSL